MVNCDTARLGIDPYDVEACHNHALARANLRAWELAECPEPRLDHDRAVTLGRRALNLAPGEATYFNTLEVALYRADQSDGAVAILERSLEASRGLTDAFDLFFLSMAQHRLGHREEACEC